VTNIHQILSTNLKRQLAVKRKTAEKLAFEAEVSKSLLSDIINLKKRAGLETIQKLAEALEVPVAELFKLKRVRAPKTIVKMKD